MTHGQIPLSHSSPVLLRTKASRLSCAVLALLSPVAASAAAQVNEDTKLLTSDADANDRFGRSIAISGSLAVIGCDSDDDNGSSAGAAYVFDFNTGQEVRKLLTSDGDAFDSFGGQVGVSGNLALIGAHGDDDNGSGAGAAYVFDLNTGQEVRKLLASDGQNLDYFAWPGAVAISGNTALIGAWGDDDNGSRSGSAYVFDVTTGQQGFKLTPDDGSGFQDFGIEVALSGHWALISASGDEDAGAAYVFDVTTGQQISKLVASDAADYDYFGSSLAISGDTALIGAPGGNDGKQPGAVYVFDLSTGQEVSKIVAADGQAGDDFGQTVTIDGRRALIGTRSVNGNTGATYLFDLDTGQQIAKLLASDGEPGDRFGDAVALSGGTALVGAYGDDDNGDGAGAVYVFNPGPVNVFCVGNANSTGAGASLTASGSFEVVNNDTTLELTGLPSNQTVLFVNSRDTILVANPGGSQGDLCIGSLAMGRHVNDILNSGATGTASLALDLANVPTNLGRTAVLAGEIWYWQAWYRDVDGGGAPTSNFSGAISVTFD